MKAFIGNDYDRGLRMLKDHLEKGNIAWEMSVESIVDVPAALYEKTWQVSLVLRSWALA